MTNNASLRPATATSPHDLVIFISVVACGTRIRNGVSAE